MPTARQRQDCLWRAAYLRDLGSAEIRAEVFAAQRSDLEFWNNEYAGYPEIFQERLRLIDGVASTADSSWPGDEQSSTLRFAWFEILDRPFAVPNLNIPDCGDLPFAPLWLPLVGYAAQQVLSSHSCQGALLTETAKAQLFRHLAKEICECSALAVYALFDEWRAEGKSFNSFIDSLLKERCRPLFDRFPALVRCVDILVRQWIQQSGLFLERLDSDREALRQFTGASRITEITCGVSDRHEAGQGMILRLENGTKILYKPKNMSVEGNLPAINDWLRSHNSDLLFCFPVSLARAEYGWVEFVEQRPCETEHQVDAYFYKAGGLICLAYLLNATDLNFENLIAAGGEPVLIDTEAFFSAELRPFGTHDKSSASLLLQRSPGSLFASGLLTFWDRGPTYGSYDLSALTGKLDQPSLSKVIRWIDVNSDRMRFRHEDRPKPPIRNQVFLRGKELEAANFVEQICEGFSSLFGLVCQNKESFVRFIEVFRRSQSRLLFRPSQVYSNLLDRSVLPENLSSGLRRNISLDQLYRPPLRKGYLTPGFRRVLDAEIDAMLDMCVPRFYVPVDGRPGFPDFSSFFWEPPIETVSKRVNDISPVDISFHREVIGEALIRKPRLLELPLSNERVLALANECLDLLYARANVTSSGRFWTPMTFRQVSSSVAERLGMYGGDLGVLALLAAVDRDRATTRSAELLGIFKDRVSQLKITNQFPLGIGYGAGSMIYGLLLLYQFSKDREWLEIAVKMAGAISREAIQSHAEPDLMSGQAGLLVALTRLIEIADEADLRQRAAACLDALAARFKPGVGWQRPNGDISPGFAHGSAGIAFASATFAELSSSEQARDLARIAIDFDRQFYSETQKNWPVLTREGSPWMIAWCNGLPGVLLSRVAASKVLDDTRIKDEIDKCLEITHPPAHLDFWCCGRTGIAEVLMHCAGSLGEPAHAKAARRMVEHVIQRASRTCFFRFSTHLDENYSFQPSLFRGLSGITYSALRSVAPEKYPSLIAFDLVR